MCDSLPCRTSLGELPDPNALAHVIEAGDPTNGDPKGPAELPQEAKPMAMHIGAKAGAERIQAGEYVDISELLPDWLRVNAGLPIQGDKGD